MNSSNFSLLPRCSRFLTFLAIAAFGTGLLRAAPLIHWKCDETSGFELTDHTGGGVTGLWSGTGLSPGWQPAGGVDGGAVSFSGVTGENDYFIAPVTTLPGDPVSISVWVKTTSTQNDGLVFLGDGSQSATYKVLRVEANQGRQCIRAGSTETKLIGPNPINDNTWHHLVGVYVNSSDRRLYINGVLVATNTTAYANIPMNRLGIGALTRSNVADLYTGLLDEVSVWAEVLTPQQIAALYALGAARGGNASDLDNFLAAFGSQSNITTGGRPWTFATGLSGGVGTTSGTLAGGDLAVVLDDAAGTGMKITSGVAIPIINSFTAEPSTIVSGETSVLSWSLSNADSARIDPGNITVSATSGTISVTPGVSRTYTLTAVNANGPAERSALVTVSVPRRLQLHWPLDEASGTTAASSTGTFSAEWFGVASPGWTSPGLMGNGLTFEAFSISSMRTASQVIEGYPFSFAAWVRTVSSGTETFATLGTGVDDQYHALKVVGGTARLTARNGTLTFNLNGPAVNDGNWNFITGVFSSRQVRTLYVNGVQAATISDDSHGIRAADRFSIGALDTSDSGISEGFAGDSDDASFWRGILSATDVATLHGGAIGFGLNAGEVARLLLGFEESTPVILNGYTWTPVTGIAGFAGQTSGSLSGGDAILVVDNAGGGMQVTAVPENFQISSVLFNPDTRSVTVTWPSQTGVNYRVEVSTSLGAWNTLAASVSGLAGQTSYTETNIGTGEMKRYYRVQKLAP
jgi:hypothetical protein